jgi:16S rRNA (uracil1498-N3)-methyltransferase
MLILYRDKKILRKIQVALTKEEIQHIKALRLKQNEEILISDGEGTAYKAILELPNVIVNFRDCLIENKNNNVAIFSAIPSGNRFEKMLDMAVQLGISNFYPVIFDFSERKDFSKERVNKIIQQAASQAKRFSLPKIHDPILFKQIWNYKNQYDFFFADPNTTNRFMLSDLIELIKEKPLEDIAVIVGPEGGFSKKEKEILTNEFKPIYLSENILRIETAVLNILSVFSFIKINL